MRIVLKLSLLMIAQRTVHLGCYFIALKINILTYESDLTLTCLVRQTFITDEDSFEIIVVDDCSTDGTPGMLFHSFENKYPYLRIRSDINLSSSSNVYH